MKSVVLDTNCLLASLSRCKEEYIVWRSLQEGRYILCLTNEIIEEYTEVLGRNLTPAIAENVIFLLLNLGNVRLVDTYFSFHLINVDEDDNKFVDCAIAANATYIVSNDSHFGELDKIDFPRVAHIKLQEFILELRHL